jgi:16S rRNA (cytidine1402-2'-O)-methyltransferase
VNIQPGKIYLVPTPIGNLEDVSQRALNTLSEVDIIACEDTRHSGRLLNRFDIKKKLISYHDFNESARAKKLIAEVLSGKSVAVITDGGSPGISDPAYRIVTLAIENDIILVPLPGATALIPALTASGLPTDRFFFEGFLPQKSSGRRKRFKQLEDMPHTLIFYESPFRIEKSLNDLFETLGDRKICVAREISKMFEQFIRGTVKEVLDKIKNKKLKGEIVLIVEGNRK